MTIGSATAEATGAGATVGDLVPCVFAVGEASAGFASAGLAGFASAGLAGFVSAGLGSAVLASVFFAATVLGGSCFVSSGFWFVGFWLVGFWGSGERVTCGALVSGVFTGVGGGV